MAIIHQKKRLNGGSENQNKRKNIEQSHNIKSKMAP